MKLFYTTLCNKTKIHRTRDILIFISFVILLTFINKNIFKIVVVSGESMYPTLSNNDIIIVNQFRYKPSRGDIILVDIKDSSIFGKYMVKRVIGLGGDTVTLNYDNNSILVNNQEVPEPYLNLEYDDPMISVDGESVISYQIPPRTIFVLGDNRNNSIDSRNIKIGMVSEEDIIGYLCLHFPLATFQ